MIRLFIGAPPDGTDAECQAVIEYTLRKYASEPLDIHWMILSRDRNSPYYSNGTSGWQTKDWPTPFSPFRWFIPMLCGFEGKAIYMDSDIIVRDDIAKLWHEKHQPGKVVIGLRAGRLCVSSWDCAAAKPFMPSLDKLHAANGHTMMRAWIQANPHLVQPFSSGNWNCLDMDKYPALIPEIKALHMTSMCHQPHLEVARARLAPRGLSHWFDGKWAPHFRPEVTELFFAMLKEAAENGYPTSKYEPGEPFGQFKKGSLKSLTGKVPSWAVR